MRKYFSAALSAWVLVYFFSLLALTGVASAQEAPIGAGTRPPDFVEEMVRNTSTSNISNISENQTTELNSFIDPYFTYINQKQHL